MENLFHVPNGDRRATNQVPYNLGDRGIEHDLLPWCEQHYLPLMAYSPLGGPTAACCVIRFLHAQHPLLLWPGPSAGKVIAIPESGAVAHVRENAVALSLTLTPEELQTLDAAHPGPGR